jgi:competence protein ComEC
VRTPTVLLAVPLVIGCGSGLLLADRIPGDFGLSSAAAALIALLAAIASLGDDDRQGSTVGLVTGALLVGGSLGHSAAACAYHPPILDWFASATGSRAPVLLHGTIREDAAPTPTGASLVVDVERIGECGQGAHGGGVRRSPTLGRVELCERGALGGVRLSVAGTLAAASMGEWRAGRLVRVSATLREPVPYRNPGVPDERRALARRGIALVGSVKSAALVEIVDRGGPIDEWAAGVRAWARSTLSAALTVSPRSAGVAAAIVIGDRTGLAPEDERRLQEAGTYHVIAISGGNIAILTVLLVGAMRLLGVPARVAAAIAILALLAYGRITGPSPSVDRAIAAAIVYLAGQVLEQRGPSLNILAVVAVLGLALSPVAVFDPGFILSFGATLAILVGVPRIMGAVMGAGSNRRSSSRHAIAAAAFTIFRAAAGLLAATVAAELVLGPVSAALFARVTFAGLLLNFAAIPLMAVVQTAALATLAASYVSSEAALAWGAVVHTAASALIDSARLVDLAPWLTREVAPPAWALLSGYYAFLISSFMRTRISSGCALATGVLGAAIVIGPHTISRDGIALPPPQDLRVVFLDVGQGDATLVVLPDRRAFLIDAGGLPSAPLQDPIDGPAFDIGNRVVSRALRAFGVRALETFVLTHADADHMGGARSVLRSFRPRAIWEGVPVPPDVPLQLLLASAAGPASEVRTIQSGDRLRMGRVEIVALHPPLPEWERQRVRNDDSVALAVRYGEVSIVLPGDIAREGESRARQQVERSRLMVLKAPHHGSATSSTPEFLAAVRPAAVIFSAGRDNRFGHPAPVVVSRYRSLGVTIFSTAEDGAVILDTDGRSVHIRGWASGRSAYLRSQ